MTAFDARSFIARYRASRTGEVFGAMNSACPCCGRTGCSCAGTLRRCGRCFQCPAHCRCQGGLQQADLFVGFEPVSEET